MPTPRNVLAFIDLVELGDHDTIRAAMEREFTDAMNRIVPVYADVIPDFEQAKADFERLLKQLGYELVDVSMDPDSPGTLIAQVVAPPGEIFMTVSIS